MKGIIILTTMMIAYCYSAVIEETNADSKVTTDDSTQNNHDHFNVKTHLIDILRGRDGRDGLQGSQGEKGDKGNRGPRGERGLRGQDGKRGPQGEQGPPGLSGGGAVYTRWGRTICPNTTGTTQVYKGLVAGTDHKRPGGGANYLCITEEPEYLNGTIPEYVPGDLALTYLHGAEYQLPGYGLTNENVPCAVCHTSQRSSKLMIPGKISCPTSWTEEYEGYLITERSNHDDHRHSVVYECMDKDGEGVPGEAHNTNGALVQLVAAKCRVGIPCGPYVADRPITCVVCTK